MVRGAGDPVPMNVLLMSTDPVALDSMFARLVYLDPALVPDKLSWRKDGAWYMEGRGNLSSPSLKEKRFPFQML